MRYVCVVGSAYVNCNNFLTDMFGQICSQGRSVNKAILRDFVKDIILVPLPYTDINVLMFPLHRSLDNLVSTLLS